MGQLNREGRHADRPSGLAQQRQGRQSGAVRVPASLLIVVLAFGACSGDHNTRASQRSGSAKGSTTRVPPINLPRVEPSLRIAHVRGRAEGRAPCAPAGPAKFIATIQRPQGAPTQAYVAFPNGVRWAICGADYTGVSGEIFNLRSADNGKTWTVTSLDIGMSPHHAGDFFTVALGTEKVGAMFLHGSVGGFDKIYRTTDGGRTWRLVCANEEVGVQPSRRCVSVWASLTGQQALRARS